MSASNDLLKVSGQEPGVQCKFQNITLYSCGNERDSVVSDLGSFSFLLSC